MGLVISFFNYRQTQIYDGSLLHHKLIEYLVVCNMLEYLYQLQIHVCSTQIDYILISNIDITMGFKIACYLMALLLVSNCLDFCEVENSEVKLFTTQTEMQQMNLNKYIRGFNLDFSSSDETVVSVFEPYHLISKGDVTIKAGYAVVNLDGINSNANIWSRQGIIFAQGGERNVSFGYGEFSNGVLPKIEGFNYYELPYISNCYSGLIYNQNLDTIIDCERTTANPEEMTDLVCLTFRTGNQSCKSFPSITKTSKRKSMILELESEQFLLSATLTDHISAKFVNQTFINVYHLNEASIEFNFIIDRRTLGLASLSIADIDIVDIEGTKYILLTDTKNGLVYFRYNIDNTVDNVKWIDIEGEARQFTQTPEGTWLIATNKYVLEATYQKQLNIIRKYELDPTDNLVTDLQSSYLFVAVRTQFGHLFTYDRKYTQLKYLLNKEDITENTAVIVSPIYPRLFQVNSTTMASIAISSGSLLVSQVEKSTDVVIKASSGTSSCSFTVRINLVTDMTSKIYQKKPITPAYRLESQEVVKFSLTEYFGGSNLKYNVNASSKIAWTKQHINEYTQTLPKQIPEADILSTKVIEIDSKSYYQAVFTTEDVIFYKCTLQLNKIGCKEIDQRVKTKGKTLSVADGFQRSNGRAYITWVFSDSQWIYIKQMQTNNMTINLIGGNKWYSQVLVGEKYLAYVEKQVGRLTFGNLNNNDVFPKWQVFTKQNFSPAQLASMGGGFYPRQIYSSHSNPNLFYIKFPIAIVAISYAGGRQLEVLSYTKVSQTYIPDNNWEIVVGRSTVLLFTADSVTELAMLADGSLQKLHKLALGKKPVFPVRYELQTDTAYFGCDDGTIQYVRLNQPALDSAYYSLTLKTNNAPNNWDVSGSWLVSRSGQVYYQFQEPALIIVSNIPDSQYKEDLSLSITVSSENEKKNVDTKVTAFNYPVKIQSSNVEDNGLTLPASGDNQIIPFPVDKYFTGSVANYKIICPYCLDGTLKLVLPIHLLKENAEFSNFDSVIGLEDNKGAVVLKSNTLKIVDLTNTVVAQKSIDFAGKCTSMGINDGNLVVFCAGSTNQELALFSVKGNTIQAVKSYLIPADGIVFKPSQIGVYKKDNIITAFIHDVDLMNPTSRDSNIKVFEMSDAIEYKGKLDSSSFQISNTDPINSMSIMKDNMLVTIGGKGLGYLNLANSKTTGSFINLESEPALKNYTLDDTAYLRVSIYSKTGDILSALVTTSNSFSYLLSFKVTADGIQFSKIAEIYKRYGHQKSLNWGLIDDNFVMLSFYNQAKSIETLALYRRNVAGITDFYSSINFVIPQEGLRPAKGALLRGNAFSFLFLENTAKPAAPASLNLYNITHEFGLLGTYDKPSSFDLINVTASNEYYSATRQLSVTFDGQSDSVKWYAIVVVIILVAIGVGVALGFYLRMKKRKADSKKVSLFTENEDIDEQV